MIVQTPASPANAMPASSITQAISTNLWGKFSDLLGRKKLYQLSLVVFMVGSLVCGLATSMHMLIFGRAIQGIGSGGLFTLSMVIMGDVLSPRERGRYEIVFTGATAAGQRLSAVVTGDRDPGYGSTSKMISEAALCLLQDVGREAAPGGVWTPGAAMGLSLVERLQARAGLRFVLGS